MVQSEVPLDIERLAGLLEQKDKSNPIAGRLQKSVAKLVEPRVNQVMKLVENLTTEKYD